MMARLSTPVFAHGRPDRNGLGARRLGKWWRAGLIVLVLLLSGCASSSHFERWSDGTPVHIVSRGETLYSIAVENDLDWRELARWNGISNPRTLRLGQILRLAPPRHAVRSTASTTRRATTHVSHEHKARRAPHVSSRAAPSSSNGTIRWQWPVSGRVLSRYIAGDPTHKGVVLGGKMGQTVRASAAGEVVYAGNGLPGYGNLIIIKHNGTMLTAYAYNQRLLVKEDQRVRAGQPIATMGHPPGRADVDKPSLLFQVRRNGKPVDPLRYLPRR